MKNCHGYVQYILCMTQISYYFQELVILGNSLSKLTLVCTYLGIKFLCSSSCSSGALLKNEAREMVVIQYGKWWYYLLQMSGYLFHVPFCHSQLVMAAATSITQQEKMHHYSKFKKFKNLYNLVQFCLKVKVKIFLVF